jgi:CheY-like chemotaxis protein
LAISKEIINAQGGEIWVESIAGSGSTFSFVLPLYYAQLKENDENIVLPQSNVEERVGSKKKILVVDDDANIRRFIIAALDDLSCRFFEAGDGLMAIQMEPLNGLDVLSVFSHDEKMSNVPILVLTVKNIDKKFMEKAIELGAKTVLQKPIDTNQLEGIVRSIIEADSPLP